MRGLDLGSWQGVLTTLLSVSLIAFIGIGIRLLVMTTVQRRRERLNRQINERLRTLIAAYKVLGGSFTGDLDVDPTHLRDRARRRAAQPGDQPPPLDLGPADPDEGEGDGAGTGSDRRRRIRDAVEAALSDIILLGTEAQVALAAEAARELVAGRPVHTHALVVSLRDFVREALDLDPVPSGVDIPNQGPARPSGQGGRGGGGRGEAGNREGRGGGGGGAGGVGDAGGGAMGLGGGMALGGIAGQATSGDGSGA